MCVSCLNKVHENEGFSKTLPRPGDILPSTTPLKVMDRLNELFVLTRVPRDNYLTALLEAAAEHEEGQRGARPTNTGPLEDAEESEDEEAA